MILNDTNLFVGSTTGILKGIVVGKHDNETKIKTKNLIRSKEDISNKNEIKCLNWSDEQECEILIGMKNKVSIFNTPTEEYADYAQFLSGEPCGIFSENGSVFVGSTLGAVYSSKLPLKSNQWDVELNLTKSIERVIRSSVKPNIVACGGKDNDLKLWDLNTRQITFNAKNIKPDELQIPAPVWVSDITCCRNSEKIASCMRTGYVRLYDPLLPQRRPIFNVYNADQIFTCLSQTSNDNQFLVGSGSGDIFLVDMRNKNSFIGKYKGFCGAVKSLVCPVDQSFVISVSLDRHFRIHDFTTRKLLVKEYMQSRLTTLLPRQKFVLKEFQDYKSEPLEEDENLNSEEQNISSKPSEKDAEILDDLFSKMEKVDDRNTSILKKNSKLNATARSKRSNENADIDTGRPKKIRWKKTV